MWAPSEIIEQTIDWVGSNGQLIKKPIDSVINSRDQLHIWLINWLRNQLIDDIVDYEIVYHSIR